MINHLINLYTSDKYKLHFVCIRYAVFLDCINIKDVWTVIVDKFIDWLHTSWCQPDCLGMCCCIFIILLLLLLSAFTQAMFSLSNQVIIWVSVGKLLETFCLCAVCKHRQAMHVINSSLFVYVSFVWLCLYPYCCLLLLGFRHWPIMCWVGHYNPTTPF